MISLTTTRLSHLQLKVAKMLNDQLWRLFLLGTLCLLVQTSALTDCANEAELERELAESQALLDNALEELQKLQDESVVWTARVLQKAKTRGYGMEDESSLHAAPFPSANIETSCADKDHLRLVNGSANYEGRLEVKLGDQWMSVCEDSWSQSSAQLVCSMMGYPGPNVAAVGGRVFGNGNNRVLPTSGTCTAAAGVICEGLENYPVRLVNGSNAHEGRVEIKIDGQWGSICNFAWDHLEARVVCRMLGYDSERVLPTANAMFGQGTGTPWGHYFGCQGNEEHLMSCPSTSIPTVIGYRSTCSNSDSVGVICGNFFNYPVRLVNGSTDHEGHVQVYINSRWSTVHDTYWDNYDASVVCGQLGYKREGATAVVNSAFGHSPGTAELSYLNCQGNEHHLLECPMGYSLNYTHPNTLNNAAGVRCLV